MAGNKRTNTVYNLFVYNKNKNVSILKKFNLTVLLNSHLRHQNKIFMIVFTKHAQDKFSTLKKHNFFINKEQVIEAVKNPDLIDRSRLPLLIAQSKIDKTHVLRVVYKEELGIKKIITFYPGRVSQYE